MNFDTGGSRLFNCRRKYSANPCPLTPENKRSIRTLLQRSQLIAHQNSATVAANNHPLSSLNPIAEPCRAAGTMFAK